MNRLKHFFRQPGAHIVLFVFAALLIGWPLLSIVNQGYHKAIFHYLFTVWGMLILILFIINRSLKEKDPDENNPEEE